MNRSFDKNSDVESLRLVVQDILKRATVAADRWFHQPVTEKSGVFSYKCNTPLLQLKQISCKVGCLEFETMNELKTLGNISESITKMLENYNYAERAVLTLAAFALEYGEFWLHNSDQNQFPMSLKSLRRSEGRMYRIQGNQQRAEALKDLNRVVKIISDMIDCIFKLEEFFDTNPTDIPDSDKLSQDQIKMNSELAIYYVVLCMAQITCLAQERPYRLEFSKQMISNIENEMLELKKGHKIWIQKAESIRNYRSLVSVFNSNAGITKVIEKFIFCANGQATLYCGSRVVTNVEELNQKKVLLLISDINIRKDDYSVLVSIRDELAAEYAILWIPVVDEWEKEQKDRFETLQKETGWYSVWYDYNSPIQGLRYAKEKWHFSYNPTVVVINERGSVECLDAFYMIRIWGVKAQPFTKEKENALSAGKDSILPLFPAIHKTIAQAVEENKYIFFYGGSDSKWVRNFSVKLEKLVSVAQGQSIEIVEFPVTKDEDREGNFWRCMGSMLYVSMQYWGDDEHKQRMELQRLMSCKNQRGWGLLCKGSKILLSGHGETIVKVVTHYGTRPSLTVEDFEIGFREKHLTVVKQMRGSVPCLHLEIQSFSGWLPEPIITCPDCGAKAQRMITYRCCHNNAKNDHISIFSQFISNLQVAVPVLDHTIIKFIPETKIPYVQYWFVPLMLLLIVLFSRFFLSFW